MWFIKRVLIDKWDTEKAMTEAAALGFTSQPLKTFRDGLHRKAQESIRVIRVIRGHGLRGFLRTRRATSAQGLLRRRGRPSEALYSRFSDVLRHRE